MVSFLEKVVIFVLDAPNIVFAAWKIMLDEQDFVFAE